jgi:hypothetical protein
MVFGYALAVAIKRTMVWSVLTRVDFEPVGTFELDVIAYRFDQDVANILILHDGEQLQRQMISL